MEEKVNLTFDMRTRIINKIARVLLNNHTNSEKRNYFDNKERLNFACPYCGDSSHDNLKKRGNLYWNDLYFHCYNCAHHVSLDKFLSDFNVNFEGDERIDVIRYIKEKHNNYNNGESLNFYLFDKIKSLGLSFDELAVGFNIYPINSLTYRAYPYLKSRFLHHKTDYFGYDPRRKELYIFNLSPDKKIIGFQIRPLNNKKGPKYRTWNIERIYDRLNLKLSVSEEDLESLNKISMIFGILNINLSKTFTIFEGPIDSMFMSNSLGLTGVKKVVNDFDNIPHARYFFDNDYEGKIRMNDKIKNGKYVFLWQKLFDDYKINSKKIKDFNDLIGYEYSHRVGCLNNIDKYFSNNKLDIVYI